MNQEKIGKFIANLRKEKNLTQAELAEKLNVTDRSISNWENGKCMPDLSLFKPLCKELGITINELLSGEKIAKEEYQNKFEENIVNTINYTNNKINVKNNLIGISLIIFGFLIILTAIAIFPSESSWSSIYSVFGTIIALVGISKLTKKLGCLKRTIIHFGFFILVLALLFILDYANVKLNNQAPRFSTFKVTTDQAILYDTPFYDVYRCNTNLNNEYWVIKKNNKNNKELVDSICK